MSGPHVLELDDIAVRSGPRDVVRAVSLNVYASERVALVGPNAAGKSTLLSGIAGLLPVEKGGIRLAGAPLSSFSSRQIARKVAFVVALQEGAPRLSVRESTELGRYPHTGPFQHLSATDDIAVSRAIAETCLQELIDRNLGSLSAGERN